MFGSLETLRLEGLNKDLDDKEWRKEQKQLKNAIELSKFLYQQAKRELEEDMDEEEKQSAREKIEEKKGVRCQANSSDVGGVQSRGKWAHVFGPSESRSHAAWCHNDHEG